MGCVQDLQTETTLSNNAQKEANEEKAGRPHPSSATAATQTTQTVPNGAGALQTNGQYHHSPPNQSHMNSPDAAVNSNVHQRRNPRSALNNFQSANEMDVVPEDQMVDEMGNVHANNYYNQTRNHNLSMVSKVTDMSAQIASPPIGTHGNQRSNEFAQYVEPRTLTNLNPMAITPVPSGPSIGTYGARDRVESTTATQTKWLWDDFSEKGSVMTTGGSMLAASAGGGGSMLAGSHLAGSHLGSFNDPNLGSFQMSMSPTDSAMTLSCGD